MIGALRKMESSLRELMEAHDAPSSAFKKLDDASEKLRQADGGKSITEPDIFQ